MSAAELTGWDRLRHGGLLLDPTRLRQVAAQAQPPRLQSFFEDDLRRRLTALPQNAAEISDFVAFVLQKVCRFAHDGEAWQRGSQVGTEWGRATVTGETAKPRHLWRGGNGAILPVFIDSEPRVGIGRGRKSVSNALQWLRAGTERLALVTNGGQFRLVFAGLDFEAWCEWDVDLWLEEGTLSPQVSALRALLSPELWTPPDEDSHAPLVAAIIESRKGQAELSVVLGERVREAVELLVQAHGDVLKTALSNVDSADIYRAAVRIVMRMVVVLFAESRELLPRDHPLYHRAYGLTGLLEDLERVAARGGSRLGRSFTAWPRVLALFRLVCQGSHHPALAVPAYGGELFAPGVSDAADGLSRALVVFERAAFDQELLSDKDVHRLLDRITRTRVRVRQGRSATWIPAPVDFSDLSTEYIGILYEGLLDFELKTAPAGDPVVFLAVGNQPALPLSRLEAMDDKALASLLENMKDTSKSEEPEAEDNVVSSEDAAGGTEDGDALADAVDGVVEDSEPPAAAFDDDAAPEDARHATRTRAESWARRAVEVGRLVRKPTGTLTPSKRAKYEEDIGRKARQLVVKVLLPGEWYLVRWGGTRKGSGTFYTRPGLAVPTVHRTLRPLAYDPPARDGGEPDRNAPAAEWIPKAPEHILALKVCDPACGSGTFPVSALRFLTDALYASLHHHGRLTDAGDRTIVRLLGGPPSSPGDGCAEPLGQELLPCRPDDAQFEPRLKAVLRRHAVERCIYGVDLDPLAVELCRLALWIETMDRSLPFSFLDHKVKCGNSLVGAWFDQFQHYPVMAWKNREGGDKNHTNGVHFQKEARTKAIKAFVKDRLTPDLRQFLSGRNLFSEDMQSQACTVHDEALAVLAQLHDLPVQDSAERARLYRERVLESSAYRSLKAAMNLWCACWFWPADDLAHAPLPSTLAAPCQGTATVAARIAEAKRFFHWELEFPDVFRVVGSGFDAILGNPPWETIQSSSMEFFSDIDPLFRSYGKVEATGQQQLIFTDGDHEERWLAHCAAASDSVNWMKFAASPFDATRSSSSTHAVPNGLSESLNHRWASARASARGFADSTHPFHHRGSGKPYTYKLFLEVAHALLCLSGRLGFIVPSGIYSDHGTGQLRRLFLNSCCWEWLFGFENRERIFAVHGSVKFNAIVLEKGGHTTALKVAFMRRSVEDWERLGPFVTTYPTSHLAALSPDEDAFLEVQGQSDVQVLTAIARGTRSLKQLTDEGDLRYIQDEFNLSRHSRLFPPVGQWLSAGYVADTYSRWLAPDGDVALPLYEGRMVGQFDFSAKGWVSGKGRTAVWRDVPWAEKRVEPQYLIAERDASSPVYGPLPGPRLVVKDVTSATNQRTVLTTVLSRVPCGHSATILRFESGHLERTLWLCAVTNSLVFDFHMRLRIGGLHATWNCLGEGRLPDVAGTVDRLCAHHSARLVFSSAQFAPEWLSLQPVVSPISLHRLWALTRYERLRIRSMLDAAVAAAFGLDLRGLRHVVRDCDYPSPGTVAGLDAKGFWRVDQSEPPELRHTVLASVAFHDLEQTIRDVGGDRDKGIEAFLSQNDGEGWMLPETVRLADYGLGHDDRAKQHQPVASRLGPRFFDWQLTQSAEESWRECHLHARNLLGEAGYRQLMIDTETEAGGETSSAPNAPAGVIVVKRATPRLFE